MDLVVLTSALFPLHLWMCVCDQCFYRLALALTSSPNPIWCACCGNQLVIVSPCIPLTPHSTVHLFFAPPPPPLPPSHPIVLLRTGPFPSQHSAPSDSQEKNKKKKTKEPVVTVCIIPLEQQNCTPQCLSEQLSPRQTQAGSCSSYQHCRSCPSWRPLLTRRSAIIESRTGICW